MRLHQHGVEQDNHIPWPACEAFADAECQRCRRSTVFPLASVGMTEVSAGQGVLVRLRETHCQNLVNHYCVLEVFTLKTQLAFDTFLNLVVWFLNTKLRFQN